MASEFAPPPPRPNIILILVDDMGWSDIGAYGGEIRTPHLDSLAEQGLRFRRCYNTGKCFPSRAALLTGIYAQASQMDNAPSSMRYSVTVGEVLRKAGYRTLASGKHHGVENLYDRGFDRYYGLRDGATNHFNPGLQREGEGAPALKNVQDRWWADDALVFSTRDTNFQSYFPKSFFSTDAFTDRALDYLDTYVNEPAPFFMYIAYTAPHDPLHAWPEDIAKYEGVYDVGYEAIREARYARQVESGLIDTERYPLSPPSHRAWTSLTANQRTEQARRMQVYAAMVDNVDQNIGRLLGRLEALGIRDHTLILFASDNGASAENVQIGSGDIGSLTRWSSQQGDWANVSNTPFRNWKNYSHEGGINSPLIANWPAGIVNPGRFVDTPVHFIDFMATFIDLSGATYPSIRNDRPVQPLDGVSFRDVLEDRAEPRNRFLYWDWRNGQAIFDGRFKLVRYNTTRWEVYDMEANRTETENLWLDSRDIQIKLGATYAAWETLSPKLPPYTRMDLIETGGQSDLNLNVLANDQAAGDPIDPATLTIVTPPLFGGAEIIATDGSIDYQSTIANGLVDTFSYQVADTKGKWSPVTWVTLQDSSHSPDPRLLFSNGPRLVFSSRGEAFLHGNFIPGLPYELLRIRNDFTGWEVTDSLSAEASISIWPLRDLDIHEESSLFQVLVPRG